MVFSFIGLKTVEELVDGQTLKSKRIAMRNKIEAVVIILLINLSSGVFAQSEKKSAHPFKDLIAAEKQIVLLNNDTKLIPLSELERYSIASVHLSGEQGCIFDSIATKYCTVTTINGRKSNLIKGYRNLAHKLATYNFIILHIATGTVYDKELMNFIRFSERGRQLVIIFSDDSENLAMLDDIKSPILIYPKDNKYAESLAAQSLFGGYAVSGRLQNRLGDFKKGAGYSTQKIRLGYTIPESVGLNSKDFDQIDSIATRGIVNHFAPAVVVLVAKDGDVIYNKAFGSHTYDGQQPTKLEDIFDLASCTKTTATTAAVMHLYDAKKIKLEAPLSAYIPELMDIDDKKDITVKEALLHEAGFIPFIPFYKNLNPLDISPVKTATHPTQVADQAFLRANFFEDVMWPQTVSAPIKTRGKFVYSDLSMYMLKEVAEDASHIPLNEYLQKNIYSPLGMRYTGYQPRNRFQKEQIVPTTEYDNWFRNMLVVGFPDDPGAALAGGVEGHAGLFSNAGDLAIYYQTLLNGGEYGGKKIFEKSTVALFTSKQSKVTNRGLGFFKTDPYGTMENKNVSSQAFGHGGYTGTYVWVDPQYGLVYICLTNKTYPDDGKTFGKQTNIRSQILDHIYNVISSNAKVVSSNANTSNKNVE